MHAQGRTHQLALERTHRLMKSTAGNFFGNGVATKFLRQIFHAQVIVAIGQHQAALDYVLQLFGHEKGAFTGASQMRRGRFEEAKGGTVFLDEIGDLPLPLQAKLLRVLQERSVERLGSNVSHPIDVRVICATSRNLEEMVQKGTFREDLYFRVSVVRVHMPPLRERAEDIPLLAEYFLKIFAKAHNKQLRALLQDFSAPCRGMAGRATCGSCKTSSS